MSPMKLNGSPKVPRPLRRPNTGSWNVCRRDPVPSPTSHRLQYPLRCDVRREDLAPVGIARQYLQCAIEIIVARRDTGWGAARAHRGDRFLQQPPHLDDSFVGRAQMLLTAVADGPHALLNRAVLHVDAVDAGERLGLLHRAVDQIGIVAVGL